MKSRRLGVVAAIVLATAVLSSANPIPIPPPASMPLEEMSIEIRPGDAGPYAGFAGRFTFSHIPEDVSSMSFPVPPDANNIRVQQDGVDLAWDWSSERYPTILPEMPTIPMIEWHGLFPPGGAVFRVDYEHRLVERSQEYIFFYALGTGKYFPTYEKATTAEFNISLPAGYGVRGVWLDDMQHEYQVVGSDLLVTVESQFGPIENDLIVSLAQGYFDSCGMLVSGVECVLFQADGGGLYVLDNLSGFSPGDRVRVRGVLDTGCISFCMQGDGCIRFNTIAPCLECDLDVDGDVDGGDLAILAWRWLDDDCGEDGDWCARADVDKNGVVNMRDLEQLAASWLDCDQQPPKAPFGKYYSAYDDPIEPNAPGYTLPLDINDVWNYEQMCYFFPMSDVAPIIEQYGLAVVEDFEFFSIRVRVPDDIREGFTTFYEQLRRMDMYLFITSDTLLHLYHVQFDETLKEIEENEFIADINGLTKALLNIAIGQYSSLSGDLQEAAKRNVAYLAVANRLIDPNCDVCPFVADTVASELAKIEAHAGFEASDIFIYDEDYSQYVPRGHYTRSEGLERYFKTLMWYGRMSFLLKGAENWGPPSFEALVSIYDAKIQTLQAVLLARSIDSAHVGQRSGRQIWERIYAVTAFYVGLADDLTPYEYLDVLNEMFSSGFDPNALLDENVYLVLKAELGLLRSPKICGGTGNVWLWPPYTPDELDRLLDKTKGMRLMGQRFIPDSYLFQHLVFPDVLYYIGDWDPIPFTLAQTGDGTFTRGYPRGLDVMAILGSEQAKAILTEEGDTDYVNYWQQFYNLETEFDSFDVNDWNQNLYWSWLYSLQALIGGFGEGYPNYMRTDAWEKKELNTALASWTELRHDTILYAKQSYRPAGKGGGVPPPPEATGYVEPVPQFYRRLLALTEMTHQGLSDLDVLSPEAEARLLSLQAMLNRLAEIADKELVNQELSSSDYEYIGNFAETLEEIITGVDAEGVRTLLVADVHTDCYEEKVVEEGVGYVDLLIVACQLPNGSIVLTAGPVLSYYEFKWPMGDRLADEAWIEQLDSPDRPERPVWFQPIVH